MVNCTAFLLGPLPSLTSSEEAAHKAAQEMQDICNWAWEHASPSPCWCGPGMERGLWRNELKQQVQWRTWDSTSIHLPYFANTAFCKSHASTALGSALKFFWILRGGDVRAGQESKWKLMTEADINQLHSMFFPAGFSQ